MTASFDERALTARVGEILNRWPVAGLAVGVIRGGSLAWFHGHGVTAWAPARRLLARTPCSGSPRDPDHHGGRRHAVAGTGRG